MNKISNQIKFIRTQFELNLSWSYPKSSNHSFIKCSSYVTPIFSFFATLFDIILKINLNWKACSIFFWLFVLARYFFLGWIACLLATAELESDALKNNFPVWSGLFPLICGLFAKFCYFDIFYYGELTWHKYRNIQTLTTQHKHQYTASPYKIYDIF